MGIRLGELRQACAGGEYQEYAGRDLNELVCGEKSPRIAFHQQPERTVECLEQLVREG